MNNLKHIIRFIQPIIIVVITIIMIDSDALSQDFKSEKDLQKAAESHFKSGDYIDAFPLFSQLLSLYPSDANFNYKFSVCMLFSDENKAKALEFLTATAKNPRSDKKVFYYLGLCQHLNYQFPEAVKSYKKYRDQASEKEIELLQLDRKMEMCVNGVELVKDKIKLGIINKTEIMEAEYFRSYDMSLFGGKLLVKPDDFKTKAIIIMTVQL